MKRGRLEEAKVPKEANGAREEEPRCQFIPQLSKGVAASASLEVLLQQDLVRRQNVTKNSMPFLPNKAKALEAQMISTF